MFEKIKKYFTRSETSDLKNPNKWLIHLFGGNETYSGEQVTTKEAMNIAVVYAYVRILSNHVAMLPLQLFRNKGG